MAVSNEEINAYLAANPGMSDADIASAMNQYGVSTSQMAQATGLGQEAVQSRYDSAIAPQSPLYGGLTATSTPDQIAAAYSQFAGGAGGDTAANQQQAMSYLQSLGVPEPSISQAYQQYLSPLSSMTGLASQSTPKPPTELQEPEIDPYTYAYEYGVANKDFSGLRSLLQKTPDSTQLISKYGLTPEQINQIEFGTGFDLDQSGGYGAGKVGNEWDYGQYVDLLKAGDEQSINEGLRSLATADPLAANRVRNMYEELRAQQKVTGDNWATGNLGSKDAAAMDFALRLTENGLNSIYDLGQRTVDRVSDYDGTPIVTQDVEYFNKKTGEALPDWGRVASGTSSGTKLDYQINFAADGTPIPYTTPHQSDWMGFREGFIKPAISIAALANPALAPYIAAGNALNAASKGDWGSAIVSGLTAASGFSGDLGLSASTAEALNSAKTGAQILNAIDKGNPLAIANALAQTGAGKELLASDMGNGVTLGNVMDTARVAASVNAGDYASALSYAGSLTNSPDLRVAGSSVALMEAIKSGDPFKITSAIGQLDRSVKTATKDSGGITNRVLDDTTLGVTDPSGSAAYIAAKNAGASDEEALEAANVVTNAATGVQVSAVPGSEASNASTKTYTHIPAEEAKVERTRLAEEYASSLGKTIGTLSPQEVDNFVSKVDAAISNEGSAVLKGASIQDILSGDIQRYYTDESGVKRPVVELKNLVDVPKDIEAGPTVAANVADAIVSGVGGLEGTTGSIVKQGLSTLLGAVGEQVADLSTSLGNIGLIDRKNAGVSAGKYLEDIGKRLELPETKAAVDTWVKGISDEPTFWGKVSSGVKGVFNNPLVLTEVGKEVIQEALPLGLAAKVVKYAGIGAGVATDTLLNALESAGSTGRQKYDEEIAKGTPPAEAAKIADKSAGYAGFITMATTGIVDSAIAKKYGDAIENYLGRKATTTGKEFGQESVEEGLIALATGDSLPEALTKAAIGGLVGGKTSGTIQTAADVQSDLASSFASQGLKSTDGSFKPDTIVPIDSTADAAPVTTEEVAAETSPSVVGEVAAEVPVASDVVTEAAPSVTGEVTTTEDGGVTTMVDGNTTTVVDANTNTTSQTTVDANTNTQTTVTVDSNTNTNTQTTVNTNTNVTTSTTVDTNNNTTTQTKIDANTGTQTTVLTDTNTNTQTTVNVNIDTGEVIDVKETEIPPEWKQPVIQPPDIPVAPSAAPASPTATKAAPTAPGSLSLSGQRGAAGAIGLPSTINIDPAMLRSRETQKAIDPLARVKEAQAELEREAMMNQIDPRLLQVMQQRMGTDQQNPQQQFDKDIGAFARMLSGEPEAPAGEGKYYAYGSEDSIDSILGGSQRTYKEGGYVQPLMAAEGGMALPLLAKSGGALGKYNGREDFKGGKHVAGDGDGQSDDIPAWLADGEFVFPADVVSALGNGSTKAGTDKLYEMMHGIRDRARSKGPKDLPPPALKSPLDYLKSSKRSPK